MSTDAKAPLTPFFETGAKESFSYRELRANFHIVNSKSLWVSLVNDEGVPAADFRVQQSYEGELVFEGDSRDQAPDAGTVEHSAMEPRAVEPSLVQGAADASRPPRARKLPLTLLRGRNHVRLVSIDDPTAPPFEFPMFYKTPTRDWLESILKALIILVLIQFFVIQTFYIPTGSMKNTLLEKDFIMVEKVSYLFGEPQRGDVVVFQYPEDPRKDFIKRMVAREADSVEVNRKKLFINGHELQEPYASYLENDSRHEFEGREGRPDTSGRMFYDRDFYGPHPVPDRSIFCMGDNRNNSLDSRMWGPLPLYRLKGKAFLVYWPGRRFGLIRHEHGPFAGVDVPAKAGGASDSAVQDVRNGAVDGGAPPARPALRAGSGQRAPEPAASAPAP